MAGFWEGFAKQLADWTSRMGEEQLQRGREQRAEERQMRMFGEQLRMKEPYLQKEQDRIKQRMLEVQQQQSALAQVRAESEKEYASKLAASYGDVGVMQLREKAAKSNNPLLQSAVMILDKQIGRILRGERDPKTGQLVELDPEAVSGMPPLVQQLYNQTIYNYKLQDQQIKMKQQQLDNETARLQNDAKRLEAYLVNQESVIGRREFTTEKDVNKAISDAREEYLSTKRDLMNDLVGRGIIDDKGRVKGKGRNLVLYNAKTNKFNEDAKLQLLARNPEYAMIFEFLKKIENNLAVYQDAKTKFSKGGKGKDQFGFKMGQKRKASDGQEYEYIGNNQWQLVK